MRVQCHAADIRKVQTNRRTLTASLPAYLSCRFLSPYLSAFCVSKRIRANWVTLSMALVGAGGGLLFAIDSTACKLAGLVLAYLWITLDLTDGEVARYTKDFSRHGQELDFAVHLVAHPAWAWAMARSMARTGVDGSIAYPLMAGILVFELIYRNLCALEAIEEYRFGARERPTLAGANRLRPWMKTCAWVALNLVTLYPNMVLIGTPLYFIGVFLQRPMLFVYLGAFGACLGALVTASLFSKLIRYAKAA